MRCAWRWPGFATMAAPTICCAGPCAKTPPEIVLWALRLAVVEMGAMQAPAHGVINDTVALLNRVAPKFAGLGNAVLRRVADGLPGAWAAAPRAPFARLAARRVAKRLRQCRDGSD